MGRIPAHFLRQQQQLIHLRHLERRVLLLVRLLVLLLGCLERLVLLFLLLERLLVVLYLAGASVKSTLADQLLLLLHLFLDASVKCTAADQLLLRCPLRSLVALFASSLYRSCRATT